MKRLAVLLFILLALFLPLLGDGSGYAQPVEADTVVEHDPANGPGIGKGIVGHGGLKCTGEASYGGYTYILTTYEPQDAGRQDTQSELDWQANECVRDLEQQMTWWYQQEYDNFYCNGAHMIQGAVPDNNNYCYSHPAFPEFRGVVKTKDHPDGNIIMTTSRV